MPDDILARGVDLILVAALFAGKAWLALGGLQALTV